MDDKATATIIEGGVQTYRKKPVEIEVIQFTGTPPDATNAEDIMKWVEAHGHEATFHVDDTDDDCHLLIHTIEGIMRADRGWYIIRGVKGEFYPCEPEIFALTYERVDG